MMPLKPALRVIIKNPRARRLPSRVIKKKCKKKFCMNNVCGLQGGLRSFLADYGVPLMVVAWSGVSYVLEDATPEGVPRRLSLPNAWHEDARRNWDAVPRLLDVSGLEVRLAALSELLDHCSPDSHNSWVRVVMAQSCINCPAGYRRVYQKDRRNGRE